jgi:hypothetical protein
MKKISADRVLRDFSTVNSLEILNTSRKPKEANLSHDLIVLLSIGKVPPSFFIELVKKALDNVQNMFTKWELAFKGMKLSILQFSVHILPFLFFCCLQFRALGF